jgi:thiamine-monophosphate kinase
MVATRGGGAAAAQPAAGELSAQGREAVRARDTLVAAVQRAQRVFVRPVSPILAGREAAVAGATAMIDVSDGLVKDAGRVAAASGIRVVIDPAAPGLAGTAEALAGIGGALGTDPMEWILTGGEDHALLATFPPDAVAPSGWLAIGHVEEGEGVGLMGRDLPATSGWDHFS